MSESLSLIVHEIAIDGLPDMDKLTGRVAFIFDGCIVSGWPLLPPDMRREGVSVAPRINDHAAVGDVLWEGNDDVARSTKFAGVTHWLEFPVPIWEVADSGTERVEVSRRAFVLPHL